MATPSPKRRASPAQPPVGVVVGEHDVRRRRAAAAGGVVHHVVVEQGEGVHQLDRRTGVDDLVGIAVAAGGDGAPVAERRPQALAAGEDEPLDLADRLVEIGVERGPAGSFGGEQPGDAILAPERRCAPATAAGSGGHGVRG